VNLPQVKLKLFYSHEVLECYFLLETHSHSMSATCIRRTNESHASSDFYIKQHLLNILEMHLFLRLNRSRLFEDLLNSNEPSKNCWCCRICYSVSSCCYCSLDYVQIIVYHCHYWVFVLDYFHFEFYYCLRLFEYLVNQTVFWFSQILPSLHHSLPLPFQLRTY